MVEAHPKAQAGAHPVRKPKTEMYNGVQRFVLKIVLLLAFGAILAVVMFGR
jgi:hypothetical protein